MSKIGKQPILIPSEVEAKLEGNLLTVKGKRGFLSFEIFPFLGVEILEKEIKIFKKDEGKKDINAYWGLVRSLVANMVLGVSEGFYKKLILEGVGFKAAVQGNNIVLELGFSHSVNFSLPDGLEATVVKNILTISGIDKQLVGNTVASIRALRKPEPYKGTGIKYEGEKIKIKAGKKAVTAGK